MLIIKIMSLTACLAPFPVDLVSACTWCRVADDIRIRHAKFELHANRLQIYRQIKVKA